MIKPTNRSPAAAAIGPVSIPDSLSSPEGNTSLFSGLYESPLMANSGLFLKSDIKSETALSVVEYSVQNRAPEKILKRIDPTALKGVKFLTG